MPIPRYFRGRETLQTRWDGEGAKGINIKQKDHKDCLILAYNFERLYINRALSVDYVGKRTIVGL